MTQSQNAHIHSIHVSGGGVPKQPLAQAQIDTQGIVGDRQADLKNHGGPERALCLFSLERIDALQQEGHPITPGMAGENLTISGLDWDALQPGMTMRLGKTVVIELTRFTTPCAKIRNCFTDGNARRLHQDDHPGWSRLYASVRQGGLLKPGDAVTVI